jgi:hypothetical protein
MEETSEVAKMIKIDQKKVTQDDGIKNLQGLAAAQVAALEEKRLAAMRVAPTFWRIY